MFDEGDGHGVVEEVQAFIFHHQHERVILLQVAGLLGVELGVVQQASLLVVGGLHGAGGGERVHLRAIAVIYVAVIHQLEVEEHGVALVIRIHSIRVCASGDRRGEVMVRLRVCGIAGCSLGAHLRYTDPCYDRPPRTAS